MHRLRRKFLFVLSVIGVVVFLNSFAFAIETPEPKSGGKFFQYKGTRADKGYQDQGRPGGPVYEYGKGLLLGPVLVKPAIEYSSRWENNIFYTENGRKDDFVQSLKPGFRAELPFGGGQHLVAAGYEADYQWFDRFQKEDHIDHTVFAGVDLNYVPFTLSVSDTFKRTENRANTEFTSRVLRDENNASALLEIPFATFFLETEVEDYDINFLDVVNSAFDYHDFDIYQRVGVDISPQTQVLVEYGHMDIHYWQTDDRDGDADQVMLGLRGTLTQRISYQIWGGTQFRIYHDSTRPDFNGFVSRAALRYDISETNFLTLKFNRNPEESTFDNQSFYVRNQGTAEWKKQIAERLYLGMDVSLSYNEYSRITETGTQSRTRRDYVWGAGAGLEYFMPNDIVSFFGEYRYNARDTNLHDLGYDAQSFNVGVRARY